jgi:uncharacterized protein
VNSNQALATILGLLGACPLVSAPPALSAGAGLLDAVKVRDLGEVRKLLRNRTIVNVRDTDLATPLLIASHLGDPDLASTLIASGADVNLANRYGITPLYEASAAANVSLMERLLKAGANAKAKTPEGETALMVASRTSSVEAVRLLLARGAEVNAVEQWQGQSALMYAAARNRGEVARELLRAGADIHARTPLASLPARLPYARFMVDFPKGGMSPLLFAAREGSLEAARVLLDAGANPRETVPEGFSALVLAIVNFHYDTAKLLLAKGANPNGGALYAIVNARNYVPLDAPPKSSTDQTSDLELLSLLLAQGAQWNDRPPLALPTTNQPFGAGFPPKPVDLALTRAARSADLKSIEILLKAGADPAQVEADGTNAMLAAVAGPEIPPLVTIERELPAEPDAIAAIRFFLDRGFSVSTTDMTGASPLHFAARRGFVDVARFLVSRGANVNAPDKSGLTPLDYTLGRAPSFLGPSPIQEAAAAALREMGGIESNRKAGLPVSPAKPPVYVQ